MFRIRLTQEVTLGAVLPVYGIVVLIAYDVVHTGPLGLVADWH